MNSTKKISPPKWADRILQWYCAEEFLEEVQGDLHEWFHRRSKRQGLTLARVLYFIDVIRFFRTFRLRSMQEHKTKVGFGGKMNNYIKTGIRDFRRQKFYAAINLFGLVAGFTSCLFIVTYLQDELSYDQFHSKKDSIYRLNVDISTSTGKLELAYSSGPMAQTLQSELPEVQDYVRIAKNPASVLVRNKERQFYEESVIYADPAFFTLFDFELALGNKETVLKQVDEVILSPQMAIKYFGESSPIGEEMQFDGTTYKVVGVVQPMPTNSHIQFDFLVSMATWIALRPPTETNWFWFPVTTYLQLTENSEATFATKLPAFRDKYMVNERETSEYNLSIEPFAGIHFSEARLGEMDVKGEKSYLYFLAAVAGFILLLAVANFINLSTAKSTRRAKEIAVRKTLGALRSEIKWQFLVESTMYAVGALALAIVVYIALLPSFSDLLSRQFDGAILTTLPFVLALAVTPLVLGFLAGFYPALVMAAFEPIQTLGHQTKGGFRLRGVLTTFQFAVSSILIFATVAMWMQLNYLRNTDPGFSKEQTLVIDFGLNQQPIARYHTLRNELENLENVGAVTFSSHIPSEKPHGVGTRIYNEGEVIDGEIYANMVDYQFYDSYELEIVAGRSFDFSLSEDSSGLVVNEATVKAMGFGSNEEILNKEFLQWGRRGRVIGVVKDFNFLSLHTEIEPLSFQMWPEQFRKISVKLEANRVASAIEGLEKTWREVIGDIPMNYYFLDQRFNEQYRNDQQLGTIIGIFSTVSIIIAVLGLIAFATHICAQRAKEMALRKVMGASASGISFLLYKQFSRPVGIAFIVGLLPAYYITDQWLEQFAYRVNINAMMLLLPLLLLAIILLLSVGYQSIQTALANPVKHLKDE